MVFQEGDSSLHLDYCPGLCWPGNREGLCSLTRRSAWLFRVRKSKLGSSNSDLGKGIYALSLVCTAELPKHIVNHPLPCSTVILQTMESRNWKRADMIRGVEEKQGQRYSCCCLPGCRHTLFTSLKAKEGLRYLKKLYYLCQTLALSTWMHMACN